MITGFRRYRLVYRQQIAYADAYLASFRLVGARNITWDTRESTARCLKRLDLGTVQRASRHLMADECSCGIYITRTREMGRGVQWESFPVLAHVIGWGAFVEYEGGWRVEHCRIEALELRDNSSDAKDVATLLSRQYGVPVQVVGGTLPCCDRLHTPRLYRVDAYEVPICRVPTTRLFEMAKIVELMGQNDYALKQLEEIDAELRQRAPVIA